MESNGPMKGGATDPTGAGGGGANIWPDLMCAKIMNFVL